MKALHVFMAHVAFYAVTICASFIIVWLANLPVVGYDRDGNCVYLDDRGERTHCPAELPRYHHSEIVAAEYWERQ